MSTKSQAYDHPAYEIPVIWSGNTTSAAATSQKFVAFTTMMVKSVTALATVMGTSGGSGAANCHISVLIVKNSTNGTSTTTYTVSTFGSSGGGSALGTYTATNTVLTSTAPLIYQGDQVYFTQGTDAQLAASCSVEMYVVPGANLTV